VAKVAGGFGVATGRGPSQMAKASSVKNKPGSARSGDELFTGVQAVCASKRREMPAGPPQGPADPQAVDRQQFQNQKFQVSHSTAGGPHGRRRTRSNFRTTGSGVASEDDNTPLSTTPEDQPRAAGRPNLEMKPSVFDEQSPCVR